MAPDSRLLTDAAIRRADFIALNLSLVCYNPCYDESLLKLELPTHLQP